MESCTFSFGFDIFIYTQDFHVFKNVFSPCMIWSLCVIPSMATIHPTSLWHLPYGWGNPLLTASYSISVNRGYLALNILRFLPFYNILFCYLLCAQPNMREHEKDTSEWMGLQMRSNRPKFTLPRSHKYFPVVFCIVHRPSRFLAAWTGRRAWSFLSYHECTSLFPCCQALLVRLARKASEIWVQKYAISLISGSLPEKCRRTDTLFILTSMSGAFYKKDGIKGNYRTTLLGESWKVVGSRWHVIVSYGDLQYTLSVRIHHLCILLFFCVCLSATY